MKLLGETIGKLDIKTAIIFLLPKHFYGEQNKILSQTVRKLAG
jgi:hypothetical protein